MLKLGCSADAILGGTVTENMKHIANAGYDKQYGARPIRRLITNEIENALSDKIIDKEITHGDFVKILYDDGIKIVKK